MTITHEHIRTAGGIVNAFGNIFFTNLDKLNAAVAAAAPVQPSDELERERALEVSRAYQEGYERAIQNTTPPAAQPAPAQEPVGEVDAIGLNGTDFHVSFKRPMPLGTKLYTTPPAAQPAPAQDLQRTGCSAGTDDECTNKACAHSCPALATPPAAQPAVPLTEKELIEIFEEARHGSLSRFGFMRGIQAVLRAVHVFQATPPAAQRQWVGLTDDEVTLCHSLAVLSKKHDGTDPSFTTLLHRQIEAKLREKNAAQPADHFATGGKPMQTAHQCHWVQTDDEHSPNTYQGTCGAMWTFTDGGPRDNGQAYCPQCGGVCVDVRAEQKGGEA